jgi:hypothetical protein
MIRNKVACLAAILASCVLASSAVAIEYTKLLPADTEVVFSINIRQILDSKLVKDNGLNEAKNALDQLLQANDEAGNIVKSLGLDPFRDLDRITVASPAGTKDSEKGLIIVDGKFTPEKFRKTAAEISRANGEILKVGKIGQRELWEVVIPDKAKTLFVVLVDNQTLLAAMNKGSLSDALAQVDGRQVELKQGMRDVIKSVDAKSSLYFAAMSDALIQMIQEGLKEANVPNADKVAAMAKELKNQLNSLNAAVTIDEDLKFQVALNTKDAETAKKMAQMVTSAQGLGVFALNQAAQNNELLQPLIEVVQGIRASARGSVVIIRGGVSSEMLGKLKMLQ